MSTRPGKSSENLRTTNEERIRSYSRKRKLDSLMKTAPLPKNKTYRNVEPKLLSETQKEEIFNKRNLIEEMKIERELQGCTFKPQLNTNSLAMARNNPKAPILKRDVPDRYKKALLDELEKTLIAQRLEKEFQSLVLPNNTGKVANKEFYDEKVAWRKAAEEKIELSRKQKDEAEIQSFIGKPQLNDYSNNKIVPAEKLDNDEFLKRVEKTIQRKKENLDNLTEKVYDFPYKPSLYKPRRAGESA